LAKPRQPFDVNDDGIVTPIDALIIINAVNSTGSRPLEDDPDPNALIRYLDVNSDGVLTPIDALIVINQLNRSDQAESESARKK
jgi:hypothetical protein